jgi:hypothetical protein
MVGSRSHSTARGSRFWLKKSVCNDDWRRREEECSAEKEGGAMLDVECRVCVGG